LLIIGSIPLASRFNPLFLPKKLDLTTLLGFDKSICGYMDTWIPFLEAMLVIGCCQVPFLKNFFFSGSAEETPHVRRTRPQK
jgi:hypothetical protein